jgi:hypothetical protein
MSLEEVAEIFDQEAGRTVEPHYETGRTGILNLEVTGRIELPQNGFANRPSNRFTQPTAPETYKWLKFEINFLRYWGGGFASARSCGGIRTEWFRALASMSKDLGALTD